MKQKLIGGVLGSVLLFGCLGDLSGPQGPSQSSENIGQIPGDNDEGEIFEYACDESANTTTEAVPLRRLTRAHYIAAVRDLVSFALPGQFDAVWAEFSPALESLPADSVSKSAPFGNMDSTVSQEHVVTYFRVGDQVAKALTSNAERVLNMLSCGAGASESACVDAFIQRFGRRAFRHALKAEEAAFLREVYGADGVDAAALHDLIAVVLNAPEFLYHVEFGADAVAGKASTFALSDEELAARLSFHFWQAPPDEELLAAAERGELSTDEGFIETVDRMLQDPRARASLDVFLREWFDMRTLKPLDVSVGDPIFDAFVADNVPSPELNTDMINELVDSFAYHASKGDGFDDWFLSPYSFARSPELASIYGVPVWDGTSEPPMFADGDRAGLLTRAALLAAQGANTRPIMRGVFIRERLLCDHIAPPPANANAKPPDLSGQQTTREVVETLTEHPGTACVSCHKTQINGLGFALEGFDSLGRARTEQDLYGAEGQVLATKPVNTESLPHVTQADSEPVNGALELADRVLDSGKVEACFARQYLRFALSREADLKKDGCALESFRVKLKEGASVADAMKALVLRPEFRQRTIGEAP